jgi:hypothetical protein
MIRGSKQRFKTLGTGRGLFVFWTCQFSIKNRSGFWPFWRIRISGRSGYLVVPLSVRSGYSSVVPIIAKKRKRRSAMKNQIRRAPNVPITDYSIPIICFPCHNSVQYVVLFCSIIPTLFFSDCTRPLTKQWTPRSQAVKMFKPLVVISSSLS